MTGAEETGCVFNHHTPKVGTDGRHGSDAFMIAKDIESWLREKGHLVDRKIVGFPNQDAVILYHFPWNEGGDDKWNRCQAGKPDHW